MDVDLFLPGGASRVSSTCLHSSFRTDVKLTASIHPCTLPPTTHMVKARMICTGTIQLFRLPNLFQNQASTIGLYNNLRLYGHELRLKRASWE